MVRVVMAVLEGEVVPDDVSLNVPVVVSVAVAVVDVGVVVGVDILHPANVPSRYESMASLRIAVPVSHADAASTLMYPPNRQRASNFPFTLPRLRCLITWFRRYGAVEQDAGMGSRRMNLSWKSTQSKVPRCPVQACMTLLSRATWIVQVLPAWTVMYSSDAILVHINWP